MSFDKVLIANRGEIALRVVEACRELSLESVAVFSETERGAPHVRLASESYCIGPAPVEQSYLNIPAMISVAEISGAQAVHPGYGFLSENSLFVEACESHKLNFIGPPRKVMELAGDKLKAKKEVAAIGIPTIPGTLDPITVEEAEGEAKKIGYPLLIKPVLGGGGRGIRLVRNSQEFQASLQTACEEARVSFGAAEIYLEKYIENPRHVEVQIIADKHGNIVHLGDRDCSVQRRHQKLIEEAPAPLIPTETRNAIHQSAVDIATALGYENAGTVEFLVDSEGSYYFIEVNARIQVEHPVTEEICNKNLIADQIRVAMGEALSYTQQEIEFHGHAIECRINTEDATRGFLPSTGKLQINELPGGHGVRIDSYMYNGMDISPYYDSLLAKLIVWGKDREEARIKMYGALERFNVEGVMTTRDLYQEIISHPMFAAGNLGTAFLEDVGLV